MLAFLKAQTRRKKKGVSLNKTYGKSYRSIANLELRDEHLIEVKEIFAALTGATECFSGLYL